MKINFDKYNRLKPVKVYLATPSKKNICVLNGIKEDTFSFTPKLRDVYELSFELDRYIIDDNGKKIESNGYEFVQKLMRIYVEDIGWFICQPPTISNNGKHEVKSVVCNSCEIEMLQHDIKNLKINKGTTDSYEMLVDGNVEIIDDVEFAKQQITFYNSNNPELSFLDILIKVSGLYGWAIGYIDTVPKEYKYYENGELKTKQVSLSDEIGTFDIESQDLYSFLTQDAAKFFSCVFLFDIKNFTINAYRPENLGKNTNINIGFRNLQNSNEITVDDNNIFTRYYVYGNDGLSIDYGNYGIKFIENLNYYLNEKYLSKEVIKKYKLWQKDVESNREDYIENTRLYNSQLDVITELKNRVPLDDCSTEWNTFTDEQLLEAQANYQAQKMGYEEFYIDENGEFDENALKNSVDANDYYQICDVILPSIQIEIDNRNLPTDENKTDYIDLYKTDWKLYGLDELQVKLDEYQNIITVCKKGKYDTPYEDGNGHTEDYHVEMYEKYLDALNQLDPDYIGGCQEAFNQRQEEIDTATAILNQYDSSRKEIAKSVDKQTWVNGEYSFSDNDLAELSKLYIDGDYENPNMFLLSSDNAVSAIDEQLKLLDAAQEDLSIASIPQYTYSTDLDNFIALSDYKNYTDNLELGDFIWLGVRDDYVVKLRIISFTYNPMKMDNHLSIEFSNILKSRSSRDDFSYLLDSGSNYGKSVSSGNNSNYVTNEGIGLTSGIIQKLLQNGAFKNSVNQMIENGIAVNGNQIIAISLSELNSKMIKVVDIEGENAFFEYLSSKLISTDKIIANSGNFKNLSTLVATIDNLLAGNVSADLAHIITLTSDNVNIDEAVIRDIIASQITVSMLQAGDIITDKFAVKSEDGGMSIIGNTMQFKDSNNVVRVQIGKDATGNFTFCLYDETGQGVLIDSTGIKESAIGDGIITNDMIADHTIEKGKLGFKVVETDENGKVSITEIKDANGDSFGVSYTEMQKTVQNLGNRIGEIISYTISLENEYQNIPCVDGLSKQNMLIEIPFKGYKGVSQVNTSVTASLLPNGVTIASNTPATDTTSGMLVLNVADNADFGGNDIITGFINLIFTIENNTISKRFIWSKTNDGLTGEGVFYSLDSSSYIITRNESGILPESINFSAYSKIGTSRQSYDGRFIVRTTTDGINYSNFYTSEEDESIITITPTIDTINIICTLYESGNITNAIEQITIPVISDTASVISEITKIKNSVVELSDTVDKNTKEISQKVSANEVSEAINNYDGTTVKSIRDTMAEHTTSIGTITSKVSEVETMASAKAEGSTVQQLSEKVSTMEQDVDGFKTTVSSTYATKEEVETAESTLTQKDTEIEGKVTNNTNDISILKLTSEGLKSDVENAKGDASTALQKANGIELQVELNKSDIASLNIKSNEISSVVSHKKDMQIVSIRYIRDWLNGNSVDTSNGWVECQVNVGNINIANGLTPIARNESGAEISLSSNTSYYTDENITSEYYVESNNTNAGWECLELDLGEVRKDVDSITVWHFYNDNRTYNHRLQISEDGIDWITLFNSDIQGTYIESYEGKIYYLDDSLIESKFSYIRQDISSVTSQINNDIEQIHSAMEQTERSFNVTIESLKNDVENANVHNNDLNDKLENAKAELLLSINNLYTRLQSVENDIKNQSEVIQTADYWKVLFKQLSMYNGEDVPDQQTNVVMSIDGIEVSNPIENTKSTLKTDGIKGYYNNEVIFQLQKDATITERIYIKRGADLYTMKLIPVTLLQNSVEKTGIAFVKSGGDS